MVAWQAASTCARVIRRFSNRVIGAAFRQWRWYVRAEKAAALGAWTPVGTARLFPRVYERGRGGTNAEQDVYSLACTVCLGLHADKDSLVESLLDAVRNHKQEMKNGMESDMESKKSNVINTTTLFFV